MKKILIVITLSLITNISYAASVKTYLKCQYLVTQNKSTGDLSGLAREGQFVQISLAEIISSSKSTKIKVNMPYPDFLQWKDSLNKKIENPVVPMKKAKVKDNSYTVEETFSGKNQGSQVDIIDRFTFINKDNTWTSKYRSLLRDDKNKIDINYIAEGECVLVDKKYIKRIIKNGPKKDDYDFF